MNPRETLSKIAVCGALSLVLWRAAIAVRDDVSPRIAPDALAEIGRSVRLTRAERDERTFGRYIDAFRRLDKDAPQNGIVSVVGIDPSKPAQIAFLRALRTNLYGRLVRPSEELSDYLLTRHRDRFDDRVFILRFLPSPDLDPLWMPFLDVVAEDAHFLIYRAKGPVR